MPTEMTEDRMRALEREIEEIRNRFPIRRSRLCPRRRHGERFRGYCASKTRKRVEPVFSGLRAALAGHVRAVTPRGFELKVSLTVLAYSVPA